MKLLKYAHDIEVKGDEVTMSDLRLTYSDGNTIRNISVGVRDKSVTIHGEITLQFKCETVDARKEAVTIHYKTRYGTIEQLIIYADSSYEGNLQAIRCAFFGLEIPLPIEVKHCYMLMDYPFTMVVPTACSWVTVDGRGVLAHLDTPDYDECTGCFKGEHEPIMIGCEAVPAYANPELMCFPVQGKTGLGLLDLANYLGEEYTILPYQPYREAESINVIVPKRMRCIFTQPNGMIIASGTRPHPTGTRYKLPSSAISIPIATIDVEGKDTNCTLVETLPYV